MAQLKDFKGIRLSLASPKQISEWSYGEVTKPETINYRTQKPEKDGLFDERIFGPTKDWECYCGKYRRIRYKGIICDKCGVEVTRSSVRRERMGHIKLATPISHIWFLKNVPSKIGLMLDISVQNLERVIYFADYIIVSVNENARQEVVKEIEREFKVKSKQAQSKAEKENLKSEKKKVINELDAVKIKKIISEFSFYDLSRRYGQVFEAGTGAEAVHKILSAINLEELKNELQEILKKKGVINRKKVLKRLSVINGMIQANIRPEWMLPDAIPVVPPDMRPMVQLDGGRYATSDLNDLYRRVINRNNRLKKLIEINAPEVIRRNEKRMLQEAVDSLIDNSSKHGQAMTAGVGQRRSLRSLSDILKGKQGRFRHNLLGKRVDYSGRSVIVVGPKLKLFQCGLPKRIALELFKPFVIHKIIAKGLTHNIRGANRLIENEETEVWAALEEVIQNRYILLNRAPTLHRLGIQAFQPVLIEGSAIQIHPLVTSAFNADFDGDQMAVHLPLTEEAQKEAKEIMLSSINLLKPANGDPVVTPSLDMVLGAYWMTFIENGKKGEGKKFASMEDALLAFSFNEIDVKAKIYLKIPKLWLMDENDLAEFSRPDKDYVFIETCVGRILINDILDEDLRFINRVLDKNELRHIMADLIHKKGVERAAFVVNELKDIGFQYATLSGTSWGMDDLRVPKEKDGLFKETEKEIENIRDQYNEGLLTDRERRNREIEVWTKTRDALNRATPGSFSKSNPVYIMRNSGARSSWGQISQMVAMKGLVANPANEIIELPVKSSFKEGLGVLEYFISTHGARKGLTDTALKTASAGYLTRRLVDVAQDIVVNEENCGESNGIQIYRKDIESFNGSFVSQITGRVVLEQIKDESGQIIVKRGDIIDKSLAKKIDQTNIVAIRVRSVLRCKTRRGVCKLCYGYDLGKNKLVEMGQAVGIVTAQSIGEPGTQLTMRTFHTGGVAGADITTGLPRIEEIFEARSPKGKAMISEINGKVLDIQDKDKYKVVKMENTDNKKEIKEYQIPIGIGLWLSKGDLIAKGDQLAEGHIDLKELLKVSGKEMVERHIIKEVQNVYSSQGEALNNKHIEIIIRQMFSRYRVKDSGDTNLVPNEIMDRARIEEANDEAISKKGQPAKVVQLLMGITKVSLTTESFLSAASFQETTRVLINAAIQGKVDNLRGLKENVIIGKLIPAGTGFRK